MSIGKMRHRVELQQRVTASDGAGGVSSGWATIATVWADIAPKSASERFNGMQIEQPVTHTITIRHRSDVNHAWRIKYGSRYFNVVSTVDRLERERFLEITASEGVAI